MSPARPYHMADDMKLLRAMQRERHCHGCLPTMLSCRYMFTACLVAVTSAMYSFCSRSQQLRDRRRTIVLHLRAWWCNGYDVGLRLERSRVQLPAEPLSRNDLGQIFHTHVPLSPNSKLIPMTDAQETCTRNWYHRIEHVLSNTRIW